MTKNLLFVYNKVNNHPFCTVWGASTFGKQMEPFSKHAARTETMEKKVTQRRRDTPRVANSGQYTAADDYTKKAYRQRLKAHGTYNYSKLVSMMQIPDSRLQQNYLKRPLPICEFITIMRIAGFLWSGNVAIRRLRKTTPFFNREMSSSAVGHKKSTGDALTNVVFLASTISSSAVGHKKSTGDALINGEGRRGDGHIGQGWTLSARQEVSIQSTLKSLEATVLHRRTLLDADTSSRGQPSRQLPIMHPACGPSIGDDTSSDTSPEHQPATGSSNPSHGGCCSRPPTPSFTIQLFDGNPTDYARFKAKFRALYENEYNGSPALLFMLEEMLSNEVRNEIGEYLADETMNSVVWDGLDAVNGRTEVMDQTYLDELLQIPPLKSQDAASLKTFDNRMHGAVVTISQTRYAHEIHSRTTLMAIEAKLTTYLKDKWNEKRKKAGAELNVLDLDDWVTVKSMSKQRGKTYLRPCLRRRPIQYGLMRRSQSRDRTLLTRQPLDTFRQRKALK
ncbi:hypothetical protein OUZ56_012004 [Daphnia magna]|uniref:Uncharacterized protein n=1 Tax=Daphnia magna TaxID=35525 RepID=A0ABQ9Z1Q8_9CRUS|nr:hypothetical protein OUZ56_012004 [Daphnia magna]